jgi:membrane protease YdiL (CAAX protease family)
MPFNFSEKLLFPRIKQAIMILLTIVSLTPAITSLVLSVNQPQVQSSLQLYQTNLNLQAAAFPATSAVSDRDNIQFLQTSLLGPDPYDTAEKQYRTAEKNSRRAIDSLKTAIDPAVTQRQGNPLYEEINFLKETELKLGMIQASRGKSEEARQLWQEILETSKTEAYKPSIVKNTLLLEGLYRDPPQIQEGAEARIQRNFRGWFRYSALQRLYAIENRTEDLQALEKVQREIAVNALGKLGLIAVLPILGGLLGIAILIFLGVQFFWHPERSILYLSRNLAWQAPWGLETFWLVLIVGFFFIGQIALPIIFSALWSFLSINPAQFSLHFKAIYIVISYLAMTISGLLVLYLALKPFRPLPADWFRFDWLSRWPLWGFGGYFVALPLVIVVSLVNQQIWQGQGGSNPLLMLALESQDTFALLCFAFTASVAAPFFEEIMFRGFLLPSLTRYLPVWGAIGLSSFLFALAHQNLSEVIPLMTLGCVLGMVYTRSRNLLSSMLVHSLWNGGTLLSLFLLGSSAS